MVQALRVLWLPDTVALLLWDTAPRGREEVLGDAIAVGLTIIAVTTIITTTTITTTTITITIIIAKGRAAPKCQCGPLTPDSVPPQGDARQGPHLLCVLCPREPSTVPVLHLQLRLREVE